MKSSADTATMAVREEISEKRWSSVLSDLFKARLTALVLLTTLVGFYTGSRGPVDYVLMFHTLLGTGLLACGAAALNQLLEHEFDGKMQRTSSRPLPSGLMTYRQVLLVGVGTATFGLIWLACFVNPLTAFLGVLDARAHTLEFHAPGQGPILHFRAATGAIERCLPTSFPLGAFPIEQSKPPRRLSLEPGDVVGLISDGIFEWPNATSEEFGVERVEALLREHHRLPAAQLAELICERAAAFAAGVSGRAAEGTGRQADDVTIVLLRRMPAVTGVMETELARNVEALEQAVGLVQSFWREHRLSDGDRFAVDFAIEELFTNMLKYGRPSCSPTS